MRTPPYCLKTHIFKYNWDSLIIIEPSGISLESQVLVKKAILESKSLITNTVSSIYIFNRLTKLNNDCAKGTSLLFLVSIKLYKIVQK